MNTETTEAPEFGSSLTWLNAQDVSIKDFRGHVTLVHFWDYTNIFCIDSLDYVRAWQERYEEHGLRIIGIHTPEFPFGMSTVAVENAATALQLNYPVLLDNEYTAWNSYQNLAWPGFYVLDHKGVVQYRDYGDCGYQAIESVIQDLLHAHSGAANMPAPAEPIRDRDEPGVPMFDVTDSIMTGYEFEGIGNEEGFEPHRVVTYEIPPKEFKEGLFYLNGKWLNHRYCVAVAKSHDGQDANITIPYTAAEVNIIVHPQGDIGFTVDIENDGQPLTKENAADHVRISGRGTKRKSQLLVSDAKMYRVVKHDRVRKGVLKFWCKSSGFAIYGFHFVGSAQKESEATPAVIKALLGGRAKAKKSVVEVAKENAGLAKEAVKRVKAEARAARKAAKEAKEAAAAPVEEATKAKTKKSDAPPKKSTKGKTETKAKKSASQARGKGMTIQDADAAAAEVLRTKAGKRPQTKTAAKGAGKKAAPKKAAPKKAAPKKAAPKKAAPKKAAPKKAAAKKTAPKKAALKKAAPKKAAPKKAAPKKAAPKKAAPKKAAGKKKTTGKKK